MVGVAAGELEKRRLWGDLPVPREAKTELERDFGQVHGVMG